jgi:simple sugar transport system permease protein
MKKIVRYITDEKNNQIIIPLISILMGLLVGSILMLMTGLNPIDLFKSILRGVLGINTKNIGNGDAFNPRYIGEYFISVMPIVLTGLSVAFAFRTGMFNIGGEGQLLMGSCIAIVVGTYVNLPGILLVLVVIISGTLAGAIWGFIPGILKARFNVHEVVVTIMLNYTALHLTNYIFKQFSTYKDSKTGMISEDAMIQSDFLEKITNNSRLHWGFILVILAVFIFWFIIEKTSFGYELRAVGYNRDAAKYAGIKVNRNIALSMMISGGFSGLAGVILAIGTYGYGRVLPSFENYGFDGIAVALLGGNTAFGSLFGGLLLGALKASQTTMQANDIPRDIAIIIISLIILFVAMKNGIKSVLDKIRGSK